MVSRILVCLLAIAAVGCSHVAERYSPSANNLSSLRALSPAKVAVGKFSEGPGVEKNEIQCGANTISPPDGVTFAEYVRSALIAELRMADLYSESSPTVLTGRLTEVALDASPFAATATWTLALELQGNGQTVAATDSHSFRSTSMNSTACEAAARRFHDAVQNVVGKAVQAKTFPKLVAPTP